MEGLYRQRVKYKFHIFIIEQIELIQYNKNSDAFVTEGQ
jgi:hypothetical protein